MRSLFARAFGSLLVLTLLGCAAQLVAATPAEALGQLTYHDCVSNNPAAGPCRDLPGTNSPLNGASGVAVNPNGSSVYVAGFRDDSLAVFNRSSADGQLIYAECFSDNGSNGLCEDLPGAPLNGAISAQVSPDGNSVYVASIESDTVSVFVRPSLTDQLAYAGCVSNGGSGGLCGNVPGTSLKGVDALAVSRDGTSVYAGSQSTSTITVFQRAIPEGQLTYDSCFSNNGSGNLCGDVPGIGAPLNVLTAIAVSPDGGSVYVASAEANALVAFHRASPGGQLTYAECMDNGSRAECNRVVDLGSPFTGLSSLIVSPDGNSVYVTGPGDQAGSDPVTAFNRSPDGQLSFAGCVSDDNFGGLCEDIPGNGAPLAEAFGLAISPEGNSVYVAGEAVTVLNRSPTGGLSYKGCISNDGLNGQCVNAPGDPLQRPGAVAVSPDGTAVYATASLSSALASFARKTMLPQTTIDSGPADGSIVDGRPTFTFSADQPDATFECSVGGGPAFTPCASPTTLGPLGPGIHDFAVRAVTDGDVDPTPAARAFRVLELGGLDLQAPTVMLTKSPRRKLRTRRRKVSVRFAFVSSEAGSTFLCKLDKKPAAPCGSPMRYRVRRGRHRFAVRAVGAAGNASPPVSYSFRVVKARVAVGRRSG